MHVKLEVETKPLSTLVPKINKFLKRVLLILSPIFVLFIGWIVFEISTPYVKNVYLAWEPWLEYKLTYHQHRMVHLQKDETFPPEISGYFWIRTNYKPRPADRYVPLLKGGVCYSECNTNHPLWLVPNSR